MQSSEVKENNQVQLTPNNALNDAFQSLCKRLESSLNQEVLTVRQAADFLHLSQSTIYTYISKRSIPFCKRNGSVWLLRSRLLEWVKEGEKQTFHQLSK